MTEIDGLTNKVVYNTNRINCQWNNERTLGNLCASRCTTDSDCPFSSVCENILAEDVQTECWYNPSAFEVWAAGFAIEDASDQTQCGDARLALGLEADDFDDEFACQQFDSFKCDPDFIFDDMDELSGPAVESWTPVSFTPPE